MAAEFPETSNNKSLRLLVVVCSIQDEPWRQELHEGFISLFGPRRQRVRPKDVQPQRRIIGKHPHALKGKDTLTDSLKYMILREKKLLQLFQFEMKRNTLLSAGTANSY